MKTIHGTTAGAATEKISYGSKGSAGNMHHRDALTAVNTADALDDPGTGQACGAAAD